MKIYKESQLLLEMAQIGNEVDGYSVNIMDNEGTMPHFHFMNKAGKRSSRFRKKGIVNCPISLVNAEYFEHGKYKKLNLTDSQIDILIFILTSKPNNPKSPYDTNYQEVISRWNEANNGWDKSNPNYISDDHKMPDYKNLNKKMK